MLQPLDTHTRPFISVHPTPSGAVRDRVVFCHECCSPCPSSGGGGAYSNRRPLKIHLVLQRLIPAAVQEPLGGSQRANSTRGELSAKGISFCLQIRIRYDLGDNAPLLGFLRGE